MLIIWSTVTYCKANSSWSIPSLTLQPPGDNKSTMSLHFPGWPFLGITPKLLICRFGSGEEEKGPATLPRETSLARYRSITSGCCLAEGLFVVADFNFREWWNPNLKPFRRPSKTKATWGWFGWLDKLLANSSALSRLTVDTGWNGVEAGKEWRTNEETVEPFDTTQAKITHRETFLEKNLIHRHNNWRILP